MTLTLLSKIANSSWEAFFAFTSPSSRLFYWNLVFSILILLIWTLFRNPNYGYIKGAKSVFSLIFKKNYWWNRSTQIDYLLHALNSLILGLLVVLCLDLSYAFSKQIAYTLLSLDLGQKGIQLNTLNSILFFAVFFLTEDFSKFLLHFLTHKIPWLWKLHRVHHSATTLTPFTVHRVHPIEMTLSVARQLTINSIFVAVFTVTFDQEFSPIGFFGVTAAPFIANFIASNFRHSHIPISFGKLEYLMMSPKQHQIHHSDLIEHSNKNFGDTIGLWDCLFKTLFLSTKAPDKLRFGLTKTDDPSKKEVLNARHLSQRKEMTNSFRKANIINMKTPNPNRFFFLLTLFGLFFQDSIAHSWGDLGHQTVAEIAERNLSNSAKQGIVNILGPETLALAAIWPDAIRDDLDFNSYKPYHFATIPTGKTYAGLDSTEKPEKDAVTVLIQFPKILKKRSATRSMKMIALRYLVHVVGDVHQPLHVGNDADMGGNLCEVYFTKGDHEPKKLHSLWDTNIPESAARELALARDPKSKSIDYKDFASDILKSNPLTLDETKKLIYSDIFEWLSESQNLRMTNVYPDEKAPPSVNDRERVYCKITQGGKIVDGKFDENKIPTLSEEYKTNAKKIIQQRILAGGLRLAHVLNQIFSANQSGKTKLEIIKDMELKN